tara:strand:+ start:281 stop:400 length:120 start_codon:yes stop_codon:yes gene_type:complete
MGKFSKEPLNYIYLAPEKNLKVVLKYTDILFGENYEQTA